MGTAWGALVTRMTDEFSQVDNNGPYNILVVGYHHHGKSAFINTVNNTFDWSR